MILKGLDESFTPSIGLMVVRARSLEIYSRTHTKAPDRKKAPNFGVAPYKYKIKTLYDTTVFTCLVKVHLDTKIRSGRSAAVKRSISICNVKIPSGATRP